MRVFSNNLFLYLSLISHTAEIDKAFSLGITQNRSEVHFQLFNITLKCFQAANKNGRLMVVYKANIYWMAAGIIISENTFKRNICILSVWMLNDSYRFNSWMFIPCSWFKVIEKYDIQIKIYCFTLKMYSLNIIIKKNLKIYLNFRWFYM